MMKNNNVETKEVPYSEIEPIIKALTMSVEDRYGIIWDAHKEKPELFKDDRVRPALVAALGCTWSELANYVEIILEEDDASIVPLLKDGFDPKGKKEMVRRMEVMDKVAGASENDFYVSLLEVAEKKVREAVIYALRKDESNMELLIKLAKSEKGNCKKNAIKALTKMSGTEIGEFFEGLLKKNWTKTMEYFVNSENDAISDIVADELQKQLDIVEEYISQGKYELSEQDGANLRTVLYAVERKSTDKILEACRRFVQISTEVVKSGKTFIITAGDVKPVVRKWFSFTPEFMAKVLNESILYSDNRKFMDFAYEMYDEFPESFGKPAVTSALLLESADKAYERFADVIEAPEGSGTDRLSEKEVINACEEMAKAFIDIVWNEKKGKYVIDHPRHELLEKPDIRWFKAFTDGRVKASGKELHAPFMSSGYQMWGCEWDGILHNLIPTKHPEILEILKTYFLKKAENATLKELHDLGPQLKSCGIESVKGLVLQATKKNPADGTLYLGWAIESVPMSIEDKLEELKQIKELHDKGEIEVKGWDEKSYKELCDKVVNEDEDED